MSFEEITFKADKKHRDKYFSAGSFAHPAKMMLPLQRWLIERYSKPGDVILDPMAGQGTLLIACTTGRHVIMVELESKFVQMQRDNWTKIQTLGPEMGYEMGTATILQGDARKLPDVLADAIISSPPYGNRLSDVAVNDGDPQRMGYRQALADVVITSPPYEAGTSGPSRGPFWERLANDPTSKRFGRQKHPTIGQGYDTKADVIMTSPPYAESLKHSVEDREGEFKKLRKLGYKINPNSADNKVMADRYSDNPDNLGNLPYGNIDCVITSPPYENNPGTPSLGSVNKDDWGNEGGDIVKRRGLIKGYDGSCDNIGNLKGDSYLSTMLEVYQGCWQVLKPQGLMILVTKNFIRNKQEIRLDLDTIKLCEQADFLFVERHYRKLISQSFWRRLYRQKYPDAPILDKEDILVFRK